MFHVFTSLRVRTSLDDDVVVGAAVEEVGAGVPDQEVVAVHAGEGVVAGPADQDVVAEPAVAAEEHGVGGEARGVEQVVAVAEVDGQAVAGGLGAGDPHSGEEAVYGRAKGAVSAD